MPVQPVATVSIILPTYNEKDNVKEVIERLDKSLGKALLEILVVDDDSPDETWKVVEEIGERDDRIKLIHRTDQTGLASAVKRGVSEAAGDVIVWMDCDLGLPPEVVPRLVEKLAISEFPKWRKYLISLSFRDKSSVRPVQVGGFEANIVVHRSTAVRGRGGPPPPWESSCRTRTGPVEADGTVDAPNAPTAPWKTLRVFHELPQGLSHRITHAKPRKAPKWRWETRIDPKN